MASTLDVPRAVAASMAVLLAVALLLAGCSSTGSDPASTPTGQVRPSTVTGPSNPHPSATGTPASARPSKPRPGGTLTFADLSRRRDDLVGSEVKVRGRVLFVLRCPPPSGGQAPPCSALAFLADPAKTDLLPGEEESIAVQLFRGSAGIGCAAHTTSNLTCADLRHGVVYDITATVARSFGHAVLDVIRSERAG